MSTWSQIARQIVLDNTLSDWLVAALAFLLTFTVLPVVVVAPADTAGAARSRASERAAATSPAAERAPATA